jgi:hypothetical protein
VNQLKREEARSASFFAAYESNANTCNLKGMAAQFAETFFAAGPLGSKAVRREDFLAFLPKRHQMLAALGCGEAFLAELREMELGSAHLLATTKWRIETTRTPATDPIQVTSTFFLERRGGEWQIVLYLAHDDLEGLLRERRAGG